MSDHIESRGKVLDQLQREILGPDPLGDEIDIEHAVFESVGELFQPWRQNNGEEILTRDRPSKRYGAGVLFPWGTRGEDGGEGVEGALDVEDEDEISEESNSEIGNERFARSSSRIAARSSRSADMEAEDDLDLSAANRFRPSVMALTCLVDDSSNGTISIVARGGRYHTHRVSAGDRKRTWWLRVPVMARTEGDVADLPASGHHRLPIHESDGVGDLDLSLEVFSRAHESGRLLTICLVNRTLATDRVDPFCLFQASLEAKITDQTGGGMILPYPSQQVMDEREELELDLLYRHHRTFAVGHGCAADWTAAKGASRATSVSTSALPVTEVPNITPEIKRKDGTVVRVSMAKLAGLDPSDDGFSALRELIDLYEEWITKRQEEFSSLDARFHEIATENLDRCRDAAGRMKKGLTHLSSSAQSREAFRLANRAVLLQQLTSLREARTIRFDSDSQSYTFDGDRPSIDPEEIGEAQGHWRPFQIAFLLMALESVADPTHPDRELVELIWFPTGGGKTEAYLGLAAFSMFLRRLRDPNDNGVDVIMRYTLRLLTAQQFQRASRLVCAMEFIRRQAEEGRIPAVLGTTSFSIGIWLGTSTTPNRLSDALSNLRGLERRSKRANDWLVVRQCPWCAAEMGVIEGKRGRSWPEKTRRVVGYEQLGDGVLIRCPDRECDFNDSLPIHLIDEDLYETRPSIVIGTVDKFALLAWKPEARALFGLDVDGTRVASPPTLILQDELHLISGPLGSLVGLYESLVEELCVQLEGGSRRKPKIVSSTATIRRFAEQVQALYARTRAELFPPPGLDASDSFFAKYARDEEGELLPGRLYVGVHAPGLGSMPTSQVRTFSSLLQAPVGWDPKRKDPWWTLMVFYNSLRELGTALSLLQSDVPDYLNTIRSRRGLTWDDTRTLYEVHELTGRLRDEEIPQAIEMLERTPSTHRYPVDVCAASSIIEVGIDIDRLSLMVVVGQPKTTAQYIQVTGRVGRRWWERPALVVTIYSPSKPRDRSHFEHFRSYHERLYAQVEPTSVTPLSRPALERALHAVMAAYVRQTGAISDVESPYPVPEGALEDLRNILTSRAEIVDPSERSELERLYKKRLTEWEGWKRTIWEDRSRGDEAPLLHAAGSYIPPGWVGLSWPTPLSMRNVDAECQAEISLHYLRETTVDE